MSDRKYKQSIWGSIARLRHLIAVPAAVLAALQFIRLASKAYEPISVHGECGFLCMNLIVSMYWWVIAAGVAGLVWFLIVIALLALGTEK